MGKLDIQIREENYFLKMREKIREAAKIHKTINFNCGFENGKCVGVRNPGMGMSSPSKDLVACGCCCSYCASTEGYIIGTINKRELNRYKKYWDNKRGFYIKREGCTLPRVLRSAICLFFTCDAIFNRMDKKNKKKLKKIGKLIGNY